jgi:hypothetical protein
MKRFAGPVFACLALILTQAAHSAPHIKVSDPSLCIDGMETDPDSDDADPILAAADGGCTIQPEGIISI